jgi:hypothetical protein
MTFRMTVGSTQKHLTALVLVLCLVVPLLAYVQGSSGHDVSILSVLAIAFATAWALAPRSVQVTADELLVRRRGAPPIRVRADEVTEVGDGPRGATLRLCGSGGFLGNFGLFWMSGFGRYWLYAAASERPTVVLRRRRGLPVVVAVDDQAGLRRALARWRKSS